MVARFSPSCPANSRVAGSLCPSSIVPLRMRFAMLSANCLYSGTSEAESKRNSEKFCKPVQVYQIGLLHRSIWPGRHSISDPITRTRYAETVNFHARPAFHVAPSSDGLIFSGSSRPARAAEQKEYRRAQATDFAFATGAADGVGGRHGKPRFPHLTTSQNRRAVLPNPPELERSHS